MSQFPNLAAEKINAFRIKRGWSLARFGQELGLPRATIAGWEGGKVPQADNARLLKDLGVCSYTDFLEPASAGLQSQAAA